MSAVNKCSSNLFIEAPDLAFSHSRFMLFVPDFPTLYSPILHLTRLSAGRAMNFQRGPYNHGMVPKIT